MSYALLILEDPAQRGARTRAEGQALYAAMQSFGDELAAAGKLRAVESLGAQTGAVRVRSDGPGATPRFTDGPFAEVKEMIGGFFLLQNVASRDEAVALAARCPAALFATGEVRALAPCWDGSAA